MSALRPWAIVAACLAAVICAVGWPQPTAWALGIAVGSAALYVGVPQLVRELRPTALPEECAGCAGCGGPDCVQRPVRIEIDPNVRAHGNRARAGIEDADGPLTTGQRVEVHEPESGLRGPGCVASIDMRRRLVYLDVDWRSLRADDAEAARDCPTPRPTTGAAAAPPTRPASDATKEQQ